MKRLPNLTEQNERFLRAMAYMREDPRLVAVLEYLFDECAPYLVAKCKNGEGVNLFRDQGAAQMIDDLRDISLNAGKWLSAILEKKKKQVAIKEGTGNG